MKAMEITLDRLRSLHIGIVCVCLMMAGCGMMGRDDGQPTAAIEETAPVAQPVAPPATPEFPELNAVEHADKAVPLIESGDYELARRHLESSLAQNPNQPRVSLLLEQLVVDPEKYAGGRSYPYQIKRGETLSHIARTQLGDSLKFPIIARYNNIKSSRALRPGDVIQIPGTAIKRETANAAPAAVEPTPVVASTTTPEATSLDADALLEKAGQAEVDGDFKRAYDFAKRASEVAPEDGYAAEEVTRLRVELINGHGDQAYELEASADIDGAIQQWQSVLALDPNNVAAQINLSRLKSQ